MRHRKICCFCLLCFALLSAGCAYQPNCESTYFSLSQDMEKAGIDIEFVLVQSGTKMIGTNSSRAHEYEKPQMVVNIDQSFYISKFEITKGQFGNFGTFTALNSGGDDHPAATSWDGAKAFCNYLNSVRLSRGCKYGVYRLPYEHEWEYVATFGRDFRDDWWISRDNYLDLKIYEQEYFSETSNTVFHDVGQLEPNVLGLYDLLGNYSEWCEGYITPDVGKMILKDYSDLTWPFQNRPVRGGQISTQFEILRPSIRRWEQHHLPNAFRVVFAPHESLGGTAAAALSGNSAPRKP